MGDPRPGDFRCYGCDEDITFAQHPVFDDNGDGYCDLDCFEDSIVQRQINDEPMPWDDD